MFDSQTISSEEGRPLWSEGISSKEGLLLEIMVQGEGLLGRHTKGGISVLQKKIEYENKGRFIKAYLGGSEQRGYKVLAGDEVGNVNRRLLVEALRYQQRRFRFFF